MKSFIFNHLISKFYNLIFSINIKSEKLVIKENQKCLFLTSKVEDMLFAGGGLLLEKPANFDVYCLTNGFKEILDKDMTYEEKVENRKKEFLEIMEKMNINYYHFFDDVDQNRLIMRLDKFKSIILSDYDYIFIPNILEQNRDNKSISIILNELLKERPHKNDAKIVMYEVVSPLALSNTFVDIEDTINKKLEILKTIKEEYADMAKSLNQYRGLSVHKNYAEAFCVLDIDNFKKICKTN